MSAPTASHPTTPSHGENLEVRSAPWWSVPAFIPAAICDAPRCSSNIAPPFPESFFAVKVEDVFFARFDAGSPPRSSSSSSSSSSSGPPVAATTSSNSGALPSLAFSRANAFALIASMPSSAAFARFPRSFVSNTIRFPGMARP
eukprot:30807-Pelagococcus_subviridis.AAC.1